MAMNDLNDDTMGVSPGEGAPGMQPNGRPHSGPVDLSKKQDAPAEADASKQPVDAEDPATRGRPRGGVVDL